ncbi:MAG: sigma 54-interacting transcriptional regulator [Candidatus Krumholzibacteriia bacterium]
MSNPYLNSVLNDILASMHDGLFVVSPDGRIIMANDALLQMTGYSHDELVGRDCSILRCDECNQHRVDCGDSWCQLFASGGMIRQPCRFFTKDGRCLEIVKSAKVVRDEGGDIIASVENVTDIGDILRARQRIQVLEQELGGGGTFCGMVGEARAMRRLYDLVERAARGDATVIIYGESGTGKELVAHAIHRLGPRHEKPFVQINCAAFNESLLESELFGHVRGAFTGAHRHRAGRFEEVADGDLFLDEVGDIPLPTQVKLLRVLETRRFERVGDSRSLPMEARLISATNQNLDGLSRRRLFRRDFFFRINVVPIHVPPLRERREDIPLLVDNFVRRLRERTDRDVAGLTPEALEVLVRYDWPGNVRELRSALEYAFVVCPGGTIGVAHLPALGPQAGDAGPAAAPDRAPVSLGSPELSSAERRQKDELIAALQAAGGNKSAAARDLGVSRLTVQNRMRKYGIDLQRTLLS